MMTEARTIKLVGGCGQVATFVETIEHEGRKLDLFVSKAFDVGSDAEAWYVCAAVGLDDVIYEVPFSYDADAECMKLDYDSIRDATDGTGWAELCEEFGEEFGWPYDSLHQVRDELGAWAQGAYEETLPRTVTVDCYSKPLPLVETIEFMGRQIHLFAGEAYNPNGERDNVHLWAAVELDGVAYAVPFAYSAESEDMELDHDTIRSPYDLGPDWVEFCSALGLDYHEQDDCASDVVDELQGWAQRARNANPALMPW